MRETITVNGITFNISTDGLPNRNNRIYPTEVMKRAIDEFRQKEFIKERIKKINKLKSNGNKTNII